MKKMDKLIRQRYELTMQKIDLESKKERKSLSAKESETLQIVKDKLSDLNQRIDEQRAMEEKHS
ncbi:MAG: hypothetical protein EOL88_08820 [Bacteroidia bacterium]|nr:hypothetical protein [Bacteroidales bacterium]NCD42179.1 hypothetical protein [Bacteroidia bacterium]MDD2323331.1 hypothetical protein [Bacteroidales bacterium]MDD3010106.1 hypothetical protein [Bacteroidales bacterium]MDD3962046.1 hypothetical protein [Bacteroidales bacterium]